MRKAFSIFRDQTVAFPSRLTWMLRKTFFAADRRELVWGALSHPKRPLTCTRCVDEAKTLGA